MKIDLVGSCDLYDYDSDASILFEMGKFGHLHISGQIGGSHQDHIVRFKFISDQTFLPYLIKSLSEPTNQECTDVGLINEIVKAIINDWDPIDLFPPAPDDEYTEETDCICKLLSQTEDVQIVADGIKKIFISQFGNDVFTKDDKECFDIAFQIIEKVMPQRGKKV